MTFFPSHCVFQDLATGKTIGLAKEQGGLYYLQQEETNKCAKLQAHTSTLQQGTESWSSSQIWLHHSHGSLSVTNYYGILNGLWIELDQYQNLKMKCTHDSIALTQFLERVRIFKFLSGLNPEFDPIRIQILGKENFPSLSEVFHIVRGKKLGG